MSVHGIAAKRCWRPSGQKDSSSGIGISEAGVSKTVSILGSTGSVGCQAVELILENRDRYTVEALTGNTNVKRLAEQARLLEPAFVAIAEEACYEPLKDALSAKKHIEVGAGAQAVLEAAARPSDWIMAGIVGAAGLGPTMVAVRRGAQVAFANKECLVCAGSLLLAEVERSKAVLLPADSEHNAIFQVFDSSRPESVEKLILTGSGGPFRDWSREAMRDVTPAQAQAHPNWTMGTKISVDSATAMNKGLEVIEASYLFGMAEDKIDIVVHPQSIIHSLVCYADGSVLAQLGLPDMRVPISYTLAWPERLSVPGVRLDLVEIATLAFEAPDPLRFPAIRLAREALRSGGAMPAVLNAANEVAVAGFLEERIGFLEIAEVAEDVMGALEAKEPQSLDDVFEIDRRARKAAEQRMLRDHPFQAVGI